MDRNRHVGLGLLAVVLLGLNMRLVFGSASALLPEIRAAYHLGAVGSAVLTTGPVMCFAAFGPLAARSVRTWSVSFALLVCMGLVTAGIALRSAQSVTALMGGTLLAGIGVAVANVLGPVFIRVHFPDRVGSMTGLFTALVSASAGIAAGLTIPLQTHLLHSWRTTLFAWALPAVGAVAAFGVLATRRNPPVMPRTAPAHHAHPTSLIRSPTAWAITGFMGLQSLLAFSLMAWLPTIYRDRGMTAAHAGATLTVLSLTSILTALTVPLLAVRLPAQRMLSIILVAISCCGLLGLLTTGAHAANLWSAALGLGQGGQLSLALVLVNLRSRDAHTAATMSTMVQSGGYLIASTGPLLTGAIHTTSAGWTPSLLLLLGITLPMGICGWQAGSNRGHTTN